MGLFGGRSRPSGEPLDPRSQTARPTEFVGIAVRSFEPSGSSHPVPYEFWTESGVPVRLHDMSFTKFTYDVAPRTLTMRFTYEDPEWTPPEAVTTPVAVFGFAGVRVRRWEDESDLSRTPLDVRGQVSDFRYCARTNVFDLVTIDTRLLFTADRLSVSLERRSAG